MYVLIPELNWWPQQDNGQEKRDAFVKGMLAHREHFPVFDSKKNLIWKMLI